MGLTKQQSAAVAHALTRYDRKMSTRKYYNIYALPAYLGGVQKASRLPGTARECLCSVFNDRVLAVCLKAIGEDPPTTEEARGMFNGRGSWRA